MYSECKGYWPTCKGWLNKAQHDATAIDHGYTVVVGASNGNTEYPCYDLHEAYNVVLKCRSKKNFREAVIYDNSTRYFENGKTIRTQKFIAVYGDTPCAVELRKQVVANAADDDWEEHVDEYPYNDDWTRKNFPHMQREWADSLSDAMIAASGAVNYILELPEYEVAKNYGNDYEGALADMKDEAIKKLTDDMYTCCYLRAQYGQNKSQIHTLFIVEGNGIEERYNIHTGYTRYNYKLIDDEQLAALRAMARLTEELSTAS